MNQDNVEQVDAWGIDGEIIQITMPSESEVSELIFTSIERFKLHMGKSNYSSSNYVRSYTFSHICASAYLPKSLNSI